MNFALMPLSFAIVPGLAGNLMVLARNDHHVTATGPCVVLAAWIPEFRAAPGAGANAFIFHFWQIQWLLLVIVRPAPNLDRDALLVRGVVHVNRLGVALEACLAAGLDISPCSPSVARKRLRATAASAFANNQAPFIVNPADIYAVVMPAVPPAPVGGGAAMGVAAPANSMSGAAASLGMFVGADGTMSPLADAEPILFPRFDIGDRGAGSGFDFFFEGWSHLFTQGLPPALAAAITPLQMAHQIVRRFVAHLPDGMLATCAEPGAARMAHVAAYHGPVQLSPENAVTALQHTEVLLQAITVETPGPEILRMASLAIQASLGNVSVNLANLSLAESRMRNDALLDRLLRPDAVAPQPPRILLRVRRPTSGQPRVSQPYSPCRVIADGAPSSTTRPEPCSGVGNGVAPCP